MNPIVYHIVSGQAFFTGVFLIVLAAWTSTKRHRFLHRVGVLCFLVGVMAIVVSSTAIPYWYYGWAALWTLGWLIYCFQKVKVRWLPYVVIAVWLIAALLEFPYHLMPSVDPVPIRAISIIGDSVSAGIGNPETEETWPRILACRHQLHVQDISHVGETASSALKRVKAHSIDSPLVLVEIGGNDILGSTTAEQFAENLDALLGHLAAEGRQILMFELPLPPFYHEYGRIQRTIAAKHRVQLIPKRVFLSVIAGGDSTLDSIHLSQAGHELMAKRVWSLIEPGYVEAQSDASDKNYKSVSDCVKHMRVFKAGRRSRFAVLNEVFEPRRSQKTSWEKPEAYPRTHEQLQWIHNYRNAY